VKLIFKKKESRMARDGTFPPIFVPVFFEGDEAVTLSICISSDWRDVETEGVADI
jgi:hypothetical protein